MQNLDSESFENELSLNYQDELIWLVAILFTDKFDSKYYSKPLSLSRMVFFDFKNEVSAWVKSNKEANKLLKLALKRQANDDDAEEPEKGEWQKIGTLEFIYWAEKKKKGIVIPQRVLEAIKCIAISQAQKLFRQPVIDFQYPHITKEKFNELSREPLWKIYDAVLYVFGRENATTVDEAIDFVITEEVYKKLCEYITNGSRAKKLDVLMPKEALLEPFGEQWEDIDIDIIERGMVDPEKFLIWVKDLPISLPMLDDVENDSPRHIETHISQEHITSAARETKIAIDKEKIIDQIINNLRYRKSIRIDVVKFFVEYAFLNSQIPTNDLIWEHLKKQYTVKTGGFVITIVDHEGKDYQRKKLAKITGEIKKEYAKLTAKVV